MKIVFHIGMGKTGTTSIQVALKQSTQLLREQNAKYLGLWFDLISERFYGLTGTQLFRSANPQEMAAHAKSFYLSLLKDHSENGIETFILSNEGLFQSPESIILFMNQLQEFEGVAVKVIAYVRNPKEWLPSAYSQWGLNHKTAVGPIPSIKDMAPGLLSQYTAATKWASDFKGELDFRAFRKSTDVVMDFAEAADIQLSPASKRILERKETAELILRRGFNNLFHDQVLPNVFDEAVKVNSANVESIEQILLNIFDTSAVDLKSPELEDTMKMLSDSFGLTFDHADENASPDAREVRDRLVDFLVVLSMKLTKRVQRLELMLK